MIVRTQQTAIQKHARYFDANGDGKVTVGEAYAGMRAVGLGRIPAALGAVAGNAFLGPATGSWRHPLTIVVDNIAHGEHPGDSGTFAKDGSFDPARFSDMFEKHDTNHDDCLSQAEIKSMIAANKHGARLGSFLSTVEFGLLMKVAGEPRDGAQVLTREKMQGFYDGSLLYQIAKKPLPADF